VSGWWRLPTVIYGVCAEYVRKFHGVSHPRGAKGVLDPLPGGIVLPHDARRIHPEQDVDAVPAHSATWVAGTPALSQSDTAA
jgi:hypothetical protein